MQNKNMLFIIITTIVLIIALLSVREIIPIINENNSKKRVFNDMQKKSNDMAKGVIGIIAENNNDNMASHEGIGSGAIIAKEDNNYYAITAKHVVNNDKVKYKIFTKDTKFSGKTVEVENDITFEIPDEEYYKSLIDAKIEYKSNKEDLAIISFNYDKDLTVLELETKKLSIKDRIMVIGHPEGNRYKITYGYIKSNLKKVHNDKVIEHDAYMKQGNSGGVAITENMKIAGINISGEYTLLGHYKAGYMIPYDIVKDNINNFSKELIK